MLRNGFQYYFLRIDCLFGMFRISTNFGDLVPLIYRRHTFNNTGTTPHIFKRTILKSQDVGDQKMSRFRERMRLNKTWKLFVGRWWGVEHNGR